MTKADYDKAQRALMRRDLVIGDLIRRYGSCGLARVRRSDRFASLVRAIVSQQLSTAAATTIARRLDDLHGGRSPGPEDIASQTDERLRSVGLSVQKLAYLRDLSRHVLSGSLRLEALDTMCDEDVIGTLTRVNGIGPWTAQMFLMFHLRRPDVLPLGDLGIVKAMQRAYGLRTLPTATRATRIGEAWRPYRSVACWYLWASLDNAPLSE